MKIFKSKSILIAIFAIALGIWWLTEKSGDENQEKLESPNSANVVDATPELEVPSAKPVRQNAQPANESAFVNGDKEPLSLESAIEVFANTIETSPDVSAEQAEDAALIIAQIQAKIARDAGKGSGN